MKPPVLSFGLLQSHPPRPKASKISTGKERELLRGRHWVAARGSHFRGTHPVASMEQRPDLMAVMESSRANTHAREKSSCTARNQVRTCYERQRAMIGLGMSVHRVRCWTASWGFLVRRPSPRPACSCSSDLAMGIHWPEDGVWKVGSALPKVRYASVVPPSHIPSLFLAGRKRRRTVATLSD